MNRRWQISVNSIVLVTLRPQMYKQRAQQMNDLARNTALLPITRINMPDKCYEAAVVTAGYGYRGIGISPVTPCAPIDP